MLLRLSYLFLFLGLISGLRAQPADGVYTHVDVKPSPIRTLRPEYPFDLKRDGVEGIVAVTFVIDEHGNVVDPEVKKSTNSGFNESAIKAIAQWKFRPAQVGGKPVKCRVTIPIRFNLDDE